jgi:hypothetical protein
VLPQGGGGGSRGHGEREAPTGPRAEVRLRLFHPIRDLTADTYGGWRLVTTIQADGGLYAQKIVTRKWYPLEAAVAKAKELVGVPF